MILLKQYILISLTEYTILHFGPIVLLKISIHFPNSITLHFYPLDKNQDKLS